MRSKSGGQKSGDPRRGTGAGAEERPISTRRLAPRNTPRHALHRGSGLPIGIGDLNRRLVQAELEALGFGPMRLAVSEAQRQASAHIDLAHDGIDRLRQRVTS